MKVSSSPEGYGSLSRTFEDPLVVFNKKDISVDVPRQFSLQRDKETDVDIGIDNTGQVNLEGVSLSFSGMDSSFYSVSEVSLGELSPGESTETTLSVEIPEAYSNAFPSLTVDVSAQAGGQEVTDSGEIQFQAQTSSTGSEQESSQNNETNQTGSSSQDEENVRNAANSGSGGISWSAPSAPDINNVTGQFMDDRSTLNMALGVITVFLMIVAVAVKKDKENGRGPAGMRNRPMSSSTGGAATSVNVSASSSSVENQEKFVHEETGKTFDTKEGLEMFEEMQS